MHIQAQAGENHCGSKIDGSRSVPVVFAYLCILRVLLLCELTQYNFAAYSIFLNSHNQSMHLKKSNSHILDEHPNIWTNRRVIRQGWAKLEKLCVNICHGSFSFMLEGLVVSH